MGRRNNTDRAENKTWADPYEGLNPEQREVVAWDAGAVVVCATAGSGKTRCVVNRIARLVKDGADPEKILATTFTQKAAGEMNARLESLGCPVKGNGAAGARVGTFHSVCLEIIRDGSPWARYEVDSEDQMRSAMKDILGYRGMNWKGADLTEVLGFVGGCKNDLVPPGKDAEAGAPFPQAKFGEAYFRHEEERERRGLITFDDMLFLAVRHLKDDRDARVRWSGRYEHIIVDEFQDTNLAQLELVKILAEGARSLMVVGDDDQCQPPGTMVAMADGTERAIEKIDAGERVRVFDRHSGRIVGSRRVTRTSSRPYSSKLVRIQTSCPFRKSTTTTPEHKFLARWADRHEKIWAVYLMYRSDRGFRIGWCQLFNCEGAFHLGQRARLEKAERVWILEVHRNKKSASVRESILSCRYGVPTAMFEPNGDLYDEGSIREIFSGADRQAGEIVLKQYGLSFSCPIWPFPSVSESGGRCRVRGTIFVVHAANIIPGLMMLMVDNHQGGKWRQVIETNISCGNGRSRRVHSLEVEEEHNYIADGIVTCNSIYEWRGARPEYLTGFDCEFGGKTLRVGTNYRSLPEIVESAARVVANNRERIEKTPVAHRAAGGPGVVAFQPCEDPDAEACWVAERIKEAAVSGARWGDFACLYRTNAQSRPLEEAFISSEIPFVIIGGTDFFKRKEVADILAYLRLAVDRKNDAAFRRAVNRPFRYIGKAALDSIERAAKKSGKPMSECATWSTHGLQRRQDDSIRDFLRMVDVVRDLVEEGKDMPSVISWILAETKYEEWLLREEGSDTSENSRVSNLKELVRTSSRFKGPRELLEHIDFLEREKRRRNVDADHGVKPNLVTCMSIHKAKGLEFPAVFLVGAANKIMPHARSENIEEERRLFFVAMTRAIDRLCVTYPRAMMIGSKLTTVEVSPFVGEAGLVPAAGAVGDGDAV